MDEKVEAMARVIYESTEPMLAPNFWRGWKLVDFALADARTRHTHHVMAQAVLASLSTGSTGSAEGWALVPKEPSDGLLMSMATRRDHGLGMPGYYDMLGKGEHEKRLRVAISEARQAHEEVVGSGFYSKERDASYLAMLAAAGERDE